MNFALGANTGAEGLEWLEAILAIDPEAAVILMTAYGDVATAVDAIKAGATDIRTNHIRHTKPFCEVFCSDDSPDRS